MKAGQKLPPTAEMRASSLAEMTAYVMVMMMDYLSAARLVEKMAEMMMTARMMGC